MFKRWLTQNKLRLLISLLVLPAMFSLAQQDRKDPIDKAQAIEKVKQNTQGRVLKVNQNKDQYKVKVLQKSGRVVSVDVDKQSGKIIKPRNSKKRDNR